MGCGYGRAVSGGKASSRAIALARVVFGVLFLGNYIFDKLFYDFLS
jgi:hypothetical protein